MVRRPDLISSNSSIVKSPLRRKERGRNATERPLPNSSTFDDWYYGREAALESRRFKHENGRESEDLAKVVKQDRIAYDRSLAQPQLGGAKENDPQTKLQRLRALLSKEVGDLESLAAIEAVRTLIQAVQAKRISDSSLAAFAEAAATESQPRLRSTGKKTLQDIPWPTVKYSRSSGPLLPFLVMHWKLLFENGIAHLKDLKERDPLAFRLIPWPSARYSKLKAIGQIENVVDFLPVWKDLIEVGFVTTTVLRSKDEQAAQAISSWLFDGKPVPQDLHVPTLQEMNDRAVKFAQKHNLRLPARLLRARHRRVISA